MHWLSPFITPIKAKEQEYVLSSEMSGNKHSKYPPVRQCLKFLLQSHNHGMKILYPLLRTLVILFFKNIEQLYSGVVLLSTHFKSCIRKQAEIYHASLLLLGMLVVTATKQYQGPLSSLQEPQKLPSPTLSIKTAHLRQLCCGSWQERATELLLRANCRWKWWCREDGSHTVNLVDPGLHFFLAPVEEKHIKLLLTQPSLLLSNPFKSILKARITKTGQVLEPAQSSGLAFASG